MTASHSVMITEAGQEGLKNVGRMLHKCNRSLSEAGRGEKAGSSSTLPGRLPSCFQQASRRKSRQFEQTGASSAQATQHSVHRALAHTHTHSNHTPLSSYTQTYRTHGSFLVALSEKHTVAQSFIRRIKESGISKLLRLEILLQTSIFHEDANNNFGRRIKHKLLKPVQRQHTGSHRKYIP